MKLSFLSGIQNRIRRDVMPHQAKYAFYIVGGIVLLFLFIFWAGK
jgi:hypothetical protein